MCSTCRARPRRFPGSTQGGIVAYSLAFSPKIATQGSDELVPAEWHEPLRQRMTLLKTADPVAKRFYGFVQASEAHRIMRRFGFVLPGEES